MAQLAYMQREKLIELLNHENTKSGSFVRILDDHLLGVGSDPMSPSTIIDFSKEQSFPLKNQGNSNKPGLTIVVAEKGSRRRGKYWFGTDIVRYECNSLKDLLLRALKKLEEDHPGTLDKLSRIKPRSKRIVARDKTLLFDNRHLVEDYSEKLVGDWWVGTNNSAKETSSWLQRAAKCAGRGVGFKTSLD